MRKHRTGARPRLRSRTGGIRVESLEPRRLLTPGVEILESDGVLLHEGYPFTDGYALTLSSQPTADVTITITPDAQIDVSETVVTFTPNNWNTLKGPTVFRRIDDIAEGPHVGVIAHSVRSDDPAYNQIAVRNVDVQITDDDVAGVSVWPTTFGDTYERMDPAEYTLVLTSQPTSDVVIEIGHNDEVVVTPNRVTFSAADWYLTRRLRVAYPDDRIVDGSQEVTIAHTATSNDPNYDGISISTLTTTVHDTNMSVSGQVYNDKNGNGQRDADDPPLVGWRIFIDVNHDWRITNPVSGENVCDSYALDPCAVTDELGNYSMVAPAPGGGLWVLMPLGWSQTNRRNDENRFHVPGGESLTGYDLVYRDLTAPEFVGTIRNFNIEVAGGRGQVVDYTLPSIWDAIDPNPQIQCDPPPGSYFPYGRTGIHCITRDAAGNVRDYGHPFWVELQDTQGPRVLDVRTFGRGARMTGVDVFYSEEMDRESAERVGMYHFHLVGKDGVDRTGDERGFWARSAEYRSETHSVRLIPSRSIPSGQYFQFQVNGTAGSSPTDTAGLAMGQNPAFLLARGSRVNYTDHDGDRVAISLSGGGYIELFRSWDESSTNIRLNETSATRSVLSGTLNPPAVLRTNPPTIPPLSSLTTRIESISGTPIRENRLLTNFAFEIAGVIRAAVVDRFLDERLR